MTSEVQAHPSIRCSSCLYRNDCLPGKLNAIGNPDLDSLVCKRIKIRKNKSINSDELPTKSLFCVHHGSIKIKLKDPALPRVVGFCFPAGIYPIQKICAEDSPYILSAIEDAEICVVTFHLLKKYYPARLFVILEEYQFHLQQQLIIARYYNAEQRLAHFMLDLSKHYTRIGYSSTAFVLKMPIGDIASYLGIAYETVIRLLSTWKRRQIIKTYGKQISILKIEALQELASIT